MHGISGIEYIKSKKQWHFASDRGAYYIFEGIRNIRDFGKLEDKITPKLTPYWFESIRVDPVTDRFFFAVENEYKPLWENPDTTTYVAYYNQYLPKKFTPAYLIPPTHLFADNKGIEAIAISDSGKVWIAPEAGWKGEATLLQDTIHILRFADHGAGYMQEGIYSYNLERNGCPNSTSGEELGGISEIVALGENQLLVLERCYDNGPGGSDRIKARLWLATVQGRQLIKSPEPAFDFNKELPFAPDNLEAMAWWPSENGKRRLLIVSDDNPGLKNKQRTQLILLEEN
ncbi:hypothetical protein DYBT9275_05633 [Dyadobacter sp. CECT 9275]|uniref:Phytase-like domain-containing protein n=1 Tax=Dyadobacter helix TaxID=2822344 RepID=A0A916JHG9_9BACT|nr:esterase-like activity of phytase family protein [Dyadobacter sp. CECT 9275]CAG5016776.1 hypothetical protein DYBT9275_05633 [Dyadobacter sp. CECT 9275]